MSRASFQMGIATGHHLANLISAPPLGASEVVILETPEMRVSTENLEMTLKTRGIEVKRVPFDDAMPDAIVASA